MSAPKSAGKPDRTGASARMLALMGLLFAAAAALSALESALPVLPMLPQGVKLGLSNIVTMYALFVLGTKQGFAIAAMKSAFVLLTRGAVAAAMSFAGGVCAVLVMLLLSKIPGIKKDSLLLSIFGAVFHNMGQLIMSVFMVGTVKILYYAPVMVLSGIVMGIVTGLTLRVIMPYIPNFSNSKS